MRGARRRTGDRPLDCRATGAGGILGVSRWRGTGVGATYRILAMLIAIGVVVQAAAIAFALFDIEHNTDDGVYSTKDSENGGAGADGGLGGMGIPALVPALLIVSFFARIPGGVKWAAITFG